MDGVGFVGFCDEVDLGVIGGWFVVLAGWDSWGLGGGIGLG